MRKTLILVSLAFLTMQCEQPEDTTMIELTCDIHNSLVDIKRALNTARLPAITYWEYEICYGEMEFGIMNGYGNRGWELVTHSQVLVHDGRGGTVVKNTYVFKRPLQ